MEKEPQKVTSLQPGGVVPDPFVVHRYISEGGRGGSYLNEVR